MNFLETGIEDLFVIENNIIEDNRGYLSEVYKSDTFYDRFSFKSTLELEVESAKHVLRGLHYQLEPFSQAKIVRVVSGEILDVVVDIRKNSKTFGEYFSIELDDKNKKQLYIPRGFAHGYYVLSDSAKMIYKMDNSYNAQSVRGIIYNDNILNIDWKLLKEPFLSEQDKKFSSFSNAEVFG